MAKKRTSRLQQMINRTTGVSTTRTARVNAGKVARGKQAGFGTRRQKYGDVRAAFGMSTG